MGAVDPPVRAALETARDKHCSQCHASCGQCHVSRPDYVNGGFLAQHRFQKTPPMETTCASCQPRHTPDQVPCGIQARQTMLLLCLI